jgi:hypothetical protein
VITALIMRRGDKKQKPQAKRLLGRPVYRWEDTIKMDLKEIGYEGVEWIQLAEDRVQWWVPVNTVEPSGSIEAGNFLIS